MKNEKTSSKKHPAIPNGLSEEERDSSESEDEMNAAKRSLSEELTSNGSSSSSEESNAEEVPRAKTGSKKKKKLHLIGYFYSMFGKETITLLIGQSNLYSVQKNPNKPFRIHEHGMKQFIGVLLMTGIYAFPQQRFFWIYNTRVQSISNAQ